MPAHRKAQPLVVVLHPVHVGRGQDRGDAQQPGHSWARYRYGYPAPMRRPLTIVLRLALVMAVLGIVREILLDRAPRRSIRNGEPVIGSLDTWPAVPRRPAV
jgi:hypothetical protein